MGDHVCTSFLMRSDSYVVEALGYCWVLHVFDVQGMADILAVPLRLSSREEYRSFQDAFQDAFVAKSGIHGEAARCPACGSRNEDEWVSRFSDWVKDAYSAMPAPPVPVEGDALPDVVRLSLGCVYSQGEKLGTSSMN